MLSLYELIKHTLHKNETDSGEDLILRASTGSKEFTTMANFEKKKDDWRIRSLTVGIKQEGMDKDLVYDAFKKYGGTDRLRLSTENQHFSCIQSTGVQTTWLYERSGKFHEDYLADFEINIDVTKKATGDKLRTYQVFNKIRSDHVQKFLEKAFEENIDLYSFSTAQCNSKFKTTATYRPYPGDQELSINLDGFYPYNTKLWFGLLATSSAATITGLGSIPLAVALSGTIIADAGNTIYKHIKGITEKKIDELEVFLEDKTQVQLGKLDWQARYV